MYLREIQTESNKYQTYVMVIDFEDIFDSFSRKELFKTIKERGVKYKIITLVKVALNNTKIAQRLGKNISLFSQSVKNIF